MKYKPNWEATKKRYIDWWVRDVKDRPFIMMHGKRSVPLEGIEHVEPKEPYDIWLNSEFLVKDFQNYCKTYEFLQDAIPYINVNIGPGSMATYLGSTPDFMWDTVWYEENIHDYDEFGGFTFDRDNRWLNEHLDALKKAKELAGNDFLITIPDIIEGIDILSAMRGPAMLCMDLLDQPENVHRYLKQIEKLFFKYYELFYDVAKLEDGSVAYNSFGIWGPGKTAKVQCDFGVLISPDQYREFYLPTLKKTVEYLDYSLYHLDGPDNIRHIDAVLEVEKLNAVQWVPGAGESDCLDEKWYDLYDKIIAANKGLMVYGSGTPERLIEKSQQLIDRYGIEKLYIKLYLDHEYDTMENANRVLLALNKNTK